MDAAQPIAVGVSTHPPATTVRRILAVFCDFVVYFAVFAAVGFSGQVAVGPYVLPAILVFDWLITSFFGGSAGRFITGVRVLKVDGSPPGLVPAGVRTAVVVVTGLIGVWVYSMNVTREDAASYRMWWDVVAGTSVVQLKAGRKLDPYTAALRGFGLTDDDIGVNESGRQSPRQRRRVAVRLILYAAGLVVACAFAALAIWGMITGGFSVGGIGLLIASALAALGIWAYSEEIWKDARSGRVVRIDGVPEKRVEHARTMGGDSMPFPYLRLNGDHKLGRRAYDSIEPGLQYRLYVLPYSGRCVGAMPLVERELTPVTSPVG